MLLQAARCSACSAYITAPSGQEPADKTSQVSAPRRANSEQTILTIGVFAVVGPPVGALIVNPLFLAPPLTLPTLLFSYILGIYPATGAGIIFAAATKTLVLKLRIARLHTAFAVILGGLGGALVAGILLALWGETLRSMGSTPGKSDFSVTRYFSVFVVPGAFSAWISASMWPIGARSEA